MYGAVRQHGPGVGEAADLSAVRGPLSTAFGRRFVRGRPRPDSLSWACDRLAVECRPLNAAPRMPPPECRPPNPDPRIPHPDHPWPNSPCSACSRFSPCSPAVRLRRTGRRRSVPAAPQRFPWKPPVRSHLRWSCCGFMSGCGSAPSKRGASLTGSTGPLWNRSSIDRRICSGRSWVVRLRVGCCSRCAMATGRRRFCSGPRCTEMNRQRRCRYSTCSTISPSLQRTRPRG
jgi:hypothetical protein